MDWELIFGVWAMFAEYVTMFTGVCVIIGLPFFLIGWLWAWMYD